MVKYEEINLFSENYNPLQGKKFRIVDLFSGCGGISLGFKNTGKTDIVGAIDIDQSACDTFQKNFPEAKVICGDIKQITVSETGFTNIDILIGGPPCQGFSALNRWEKEKDNDPRNRLFLEYLRFVDELRPRAIMIENVKQILTAKNGYAPKHITEFMESRGYKVSFKILNAADFGVPQKRERAIIVAFRKEYGSFDFNILEKYKLPKVTVKEALSDIEAIEEEAIKHEQGTIFTLGAPKSDYQRAMQTFDRKLPNHMIYYPAANVQEMISYVHEGGNWKDVPKKLFKSERNNRHSNYLRRIESQSQSVTIDTGHNVYFHPHFNRVPTIRESARIQSFPDSFVFTGKKGQQFRQVGNAVPPKLAEAVARAIMEVIESYEKEHMKKYRLLDLFCGAGGLSCGFERKNYEVVKAIDFAKYAVETYNYNRKNKVAEVKDIKEIDDSFIETLGEIDGIIGGPPCQGFSTAGDRIIDDERNVLYRDYFKILEKVKPKFFLIENVIGILTFAKGAIVADIMRRADSLGYEVFSEVLSTQDYGIPQIRKRVIFIGISKKLVHGKFEFPRPNGVTVTVEEAIGDLPSLDKGEDNTKYNKNPKTDYERYIRNGCTELHNHMQSAHTDEVKKAISLVPEGGDMRDIPEEKRGGRNYHALLRKMDRNKPSLCIDTGHRTYFHYEELRVPSVREAARLQSFKDDYIFIGPKQEQYKQVGNAVPPMLAELLAEQIQQYLQEAEL